MKNSELIIQDASDIIKVNESRAITFTQCAYATNEMRLKELLNRETDNAQDNIIKLKRLIKDHYGYSTDDVTPGAIFLNWHDNKPTFDSQHDETLLYDIEVADFITLQCYSLALRKSVVDEWLKNLLEFQHHNGIAIYKTIRNHKEALLRSRQSLIYQ